MPSSPCTIGAGGAGCRFGLEGFRPLDVAGGVGAGAGGLTTTARWWQADKNSARPARNTSGPSLLSIGERVLEWIVLTTISDFARFFVKTSSFELVPPRDILAKRIRPYKHIPQ